MLPFLATPMWLPLPDWSYKRETVQTVPAQKASLGRGVREAIRRLQNVFGHAARAGVLGRAAIPDLIQRAGVLAAEAPNRAVSGDARRVPGGVDVARAISAGDDRPAAGGTCRAGTTAAPVEPATLPPPAVAGAPPTPGAPPVLPAPPAPPELPL